MKRWIGLFLTALAAMTAGAQDVLTITETGGQVAVVSYEWTSDGAGAASGRTSVLVPGVVFSAVTTPGTGSDAPTDNYDVVVKQVFSAVGGGVNVIATDVAGGDLANRDDTGPEVVEFWPDTVTQVSGMVQIDISNAGAVNKGRVDLAIARHLAIRTSDIQLVGGSAGQVLQYQAPGIVKFVTISGDGTLADGGALSVSGGGGGGGDALTTNPLSQFASTTSLQLLGVMSDETGTGALVFGTSPTLTGPSLGTPTLLVLTNATGLPIATGLAAGTSADLAGRISDETGSGALVFGTSPVLTLSNATGLPIATGLAAGTSSDLLGRISDETGTGLLVFGTSPTFITPVLGTPQSGNLANCTFPTLNQSTTGSAATLTTPRAIYGNNFDGSAALTQIIASTYGGTGNGFTKFTGPATTERTFTLPNTNATLASVGGANTWTAAQSFNSSMMVLKGATSGTTTVNATAVAGTTVLTMPAATDTVVARATTDTLTNKRVTPRTGTTTSSATPTINTDNVDFYSLTAQAVDITSMTTNLSGTPTNGQKLWIAITGTAARAITWGASFESSTITLPSTTVTTARLDIGLVWNAVTSKWRCVAVA